jgi:hypothetical protein
MENGKREARVEIRGVGRKQTQQTALSSISELPLINEGVFKGLAFLFCKMEMETDPTSLDYCED